MGQQIHFVTGKGGVGKSMVALAMAQSAAEKGLKTLLVELGDHSFYQDLLNSELGSQKVGFQPVSLGANIDIALWTGAECLREYAKHLIKVEALARLFFENPVTRSLINVAPALSELAIMGKLTSTYRRHGPPLLYDLIVVDGFATGHFLSLMRASRGMAEAIQFGPMGEQSRSIDAALSNKDLCSYTVVTLPEELPLKEAVELQQQLKAEFLIESQLVVNRYLRLPVSEADLAEKYQQSSLKVFADYLLFQEQKQETAMAEFVSASAAFSSEPIFVGLQFEAAPLKLAKKMAKDMGL